MTVHANANGASTSELEFNVPFQHKHGYIRDERRLYDVGGLSEHVFWFLSQLLISHFFSRTAHTGGPILTTNTSYDLFRGRVPFGVGDETEPAV